MNHDNDSHNLSFRDIDDKVESHENDIDIITYIDIDFYANNAKDIDNKVVLRQ